MKKSITNSITNGQKKQIVRVCEDAASKAAAEAVEEALLTRRLAQEILSAGDKLQVKLKEVVAQFICGVSVELRATEDTRTYLRNFNLTITIPAKPECKVANCFTDKVIFAYRDADFDNWLPAILPASAEVAVNGYELTKVTTETELAKVGKPFTNPTQIEDLILRTERGENSGLKTNGFANLFFLKVGTSVFTVSAYRHPGGWFVNLYLFYARSEWYVESRFFSPAT